MSRKLASRAGAIRPTLIREITDSARPTSLHLGLGQPDLPVPDVVRTAVEEQVSRGYAPYSPNLGLPAARTAVAQHLGCEPSETMLTVGVQEAMAVAILGTVEPGDDVLVPDPGFPAYANLVRAAGGRPVSYPLTETFDIDAEGLMAAATSATTVVVLNSPSNPTGGVSSRDALQAVVDWCADNGALWISDEIYEDFVWLGEHVSPRVLTDDPDAGIVLGGLSKVCSMMGWRLGWLIASAATVDGLKPLHQHLVTCAPTLAQHAAIAALEAHPSIVADIRSEFSARRAVLLDILGEMSTMKMAAPAGAFYAFPDVTPWSNRFGGSLQMCKALLHEADVVTIPGVGFGPGGEGHIRIAYTVETDLLKDAIGRVVEFLNRYQP